MAKTRKSYSREFKLKVLEFSAKKGVSAAAQQFDLDDHFTIRRWRRSKFIIEETRKGRAYFRDFTVVPYFVIRSLVGPLNNTSVKGNMVTVLYSCFLL